MSKYKHEIIIVIISILVLPVAADSLMTYLNTPSPDLVLGGPYAGDTLNDGEGSISFKLSNLADEAGSAIFCVSSKEFVLKGVIDDDYVHNICFVEKTIYPTSNGEFYPYQIFIMPDQNYGDLMENGTIDVEITCSQTISKVISVGCEDIHKSFHYDRTYRGLTLQ